MKRPALDRSVVIVVTGIVIALVMRLPTLHLRGLGPTVSAILFVLVLPGLAWRRLWPRALDEGYEAVALVIGASLALNAVALLIVDAMTIPLTTLSFGMTSIVVTLVGAALPSQRPSDDWSVTESLDWIRRNASVSVVVVICLCVLGLTAAWALSTARSDHDGPTTALWQIPGPDVNQIIVGVQSGLREPATFVTTTTGSGGFRTTHAFHLDARGAANYRFRIPSVQTVTTNLAIAPSTAPLRTVVLSSYQIQISNSHARNAGSTTTTAPARTSTTVRAQTVTTTATTKPSSAVTPTTAGSPHAASVH